MIPHGKNLKENSKVQINKRTQKWNHAKKKNDRYKTNRARDDPTGRNR